MTDLRDQHAIPLTDRAQAVNVLADLRRNRDLTQRQLADQLHVHRKTVCYRENLLVGLETGELIRTARALGHTVALLPDARPGRPTGTGWPT